MAAGECRPAWRGMRVTSATLDELAALAWTARGAARILGATAVGAAALGAGGGRWAGCNVEHTFRSHDIHAETNAISSMVADGERDLRALVVVAERERFTPCGACLDWIWEFGGAECLVGIQTSPRAGLEVLTAMALMPHYPR